MRRIISLAAAAAFLAFANAPAPAMAQVEDKTAATHCLKEAGAVEIGVYRNRTVCYSKALFPAPIPESQCADGGKYGGFLRHYMMAGGELYCVISIGRWEENGHVAAKIKPDSGALADWRSNQYHCSNLEGLWKILGTYQQSVVCMMRSSGQGDVAERNCGKSGTGYAGGVVARFGADNYCLLQTGANASRFG